MTLTGTPAAADASPSPTAGVLRRAPGVELLGVQPGSGYVTPPSLARRADGAVVSLTPLLSAVLEAMDGTPAEVAARASAASGRGLGPGDVVALVDKLRSLGLARLADGSAPAVRAASPLLALKPRLVVSDPAVTRRVTAPFAVLFRPLLAIPLVLAAAVAIVAVLFRDGLAGAAHDALTRPSTLLVVTAVTLLSAALHEFGHAAALRRAGGLPGAMGAGLYIVWPAFYTDVTDSYRLPRRQRLLVDLGGLYFNALVAALGYAAWLLAGWRPLLLVVAAQVLQMLRQLPPLVRFDGYHLLADIVGVPDLFHRIGPTLRGMLPWRRERSAGGLRPWARAVVALWVLLVVPLLLLTLVVSVAALPRVLATSWSSVGHQLASLRASAPAASALHLVSALALALPAVGLVLVLVRTSRRVVMTTARRTAGHPARQATAAVTGLALLAALGFAWWPRDQYRPIAAYERGTVTDALPASLTGAVHGLHPGRISSGRTVWPLAGALPTSDHPALALVVSPRDGHGPTYVLPVGAAGSPDAWPFPFGRPIAAGAGDAQALAVATMNGGRAYDAAFALVWARGDTVLDRNEAYAFASCRGCRATAISFEVVVVVGHPHVVAPINLAGAVSARCPTCVTQALALQVVAQLSGEPTATTRARLAAIWRSLAIARRGFGALDFATVRSVLLHFEKLIEQALAADPSAVAVPGTSVQPTPQPLPSSSPSTSADVTGATASPTPSGLGGATASPTAQPTAGAGAATPATPASTPSTSPSASASAGTTSSAAPSPSASASP